MKKVADGLSNQIEDVAGSVSGGMFPTVQKCSSQNISSRKRYYVPNCGTWYVAFIYDENGTVRDWSGSYSGGTQLIEIESSYDIYCHIAIKIA